MNERTTLAFGNTEEAYPLDVSMFTLSGIDCTLVKIINHSLETEVPVNNFETFLEVTSEFKPGLKLSKVYGFANSLYFELNISLKLAANQTDTAVSEAHFTFLFCFELKSLTEYFTQNQKEELGLITLANMAGLAYSTCRGILINDLAKSNFSGFLLPIVNPITLVKS